MRKWPCCTRFDDEDSIDDALDHEFIDRIKRLERNERKKKYEAQPRRNKVGRGKDKRETQKPDNLFG